MPEEGMEETKGVEEETKGEEERPKWNNKAEYLLTCIGFAVGLGNVWRFPYLCQIYGGGAFQFPYLITLVFDPCVPDPIPDSPGAFLIPYLIALVFDPCPLSPFPRCVPDPLPDSPGVSRSASALFGAGYRTEAPHGQRVASMVVSFCVSLFYNTIVAWVLWYLFNSFQEPLPWSQCPLNHNNTGYVEECVESTPVNYFWYRQTLNITPNMDTSGSLQWWMVVSLGTAWAIVYICFIRGIETIGKAVYVTATFPYLVLTIFLWEILKNPQVWLDAATQIFFSLSVAFGGLISFSSYNSLKNDCERDAVVVGVINSATSIYASIPIFAILGFKAHTNYVTCLNGNILALTNEFEISDMNITVENYDQWFDSLNGTHPARVSDLNLKTCDLQTFLDQSASGTGLAFIVFTEAVISMPGSQVWAVLFFVMLFSLGLSSMFGNLEGVLTPLHDLKLVPKWMPNELFTAIICLVSFLLALIFCLGSGNYWLEIFNSYVGSVPLLIIAFFEIIAVAYVYGIGRFSDDLEFMTGRRPNIFWKACWLVISPLMLVVVLVNFPDTEVLPYPDWVFAICVLLSSVPVLSIPLVAIYRLICCMMPEEGMEETKGEEERPKWNNKAEYLLTCIGFAVGVGNVWRFPYLCQIYGGGAFLIPYLIALVFDPCVPDPLPDSPGAFLIPYLIALVFDPCVPDPLPDSPGAFLIPYLIALVFDPCVPDPLPDSPGAFLIPYLIALVFDPCAFLIPYLIALVFDPCPLSPLPRCSLYDGVLLCESVLQHYRGLGYVEECVESTPVNYFWYRQTLNITPNMDTSGSLQWWMVGTRPWKEATVLNPVAGTNTKFVIANFKWEIMKNPQVWLDAATQIFFSLSVAFGGLISFSRMTERDAVVVGVINSATSIYASIPIFAILGFKAHTNYVTCLNGNILALTNEFEISDMNITVENYDQWFDSLNGTHPARVSDLNLKTCDLQTFLDQSASGTGLAFIVFTEAVISMPGSQVWAVLFFVMLFSLGLSSMFGNLEGVLTPLHDLKLVPKWMPNELFTAIICLVMFLLALIFCLGSGNYWLEIFNSYVGSIPFLIIAFFEIIAVVYVYGIGRFSDDLEFMTGRRPNIFWKVCWLVISPLMLVVVLVAYVAVQAQKHPTYPAWNPDYVNFPDTEVLPYPDWVFAICVLLSSVPVLSIPLVAIYRLICC
ncbi:unnamed protein product, partial [Coregonus sp. 'balchen']